MQKYELGIAGNGAKCSLCTKPIEERASYALFHSKMVCIPCTSKIVHEAEELMLKEVEAEAKP